MQTPAFKLKPLHTLGIMLACAALAAGCAGNRANPMNSETTPTANVTTNSTSPLAKTDSKLITASPEQPQKETVMTASTNTQVQLVDDHSKPADSEVTGADQADIQQPAQTTFYFGFNKTELDDQDKTVLGEHARFLKANPALVLQINGHTDHSGPHGYNEFLSKQRAESVARVLIADGIQRSQLVIKALADDKPLMDNGNPGKNRRVELQYDEMDMLTSR